MITISLLATKALTSFAGVLGKTAARQLLQVDVVKRSILEVDRHFQQLEGVGDALRRWLQDERAIRCFESLKNGDPTPTVSEDLIRSFVEQDFFVHSHTKEFAIKVLDVFFDCLYDNLMRDPKDALLVHDRREATRSRALSAQLEEILRFLRSGKDPIPLSFSTSIDNFIVDYLERHDGPVPFGGRTEELARLTRWLDCPSGTPYLLLTSEAGQGKSALLVRWVQQIVPRPDVSVVFVPISVRYGTSLSSVFFTILASRLAGIHGKEPPVVNASGDVWKRVAANYLSQSVTNGRTLVVVLDGIDEAADWQPHRDLFPTIAPIGLRVLVAARLRANDPDGRQWLRQLGWERYEPDAILKLRPLDEEGVLDVFHSAAPGVLLAEESEWSEQIHRLSKGDAFIVNLYIADLREAVRSGKSPHPQDLQARTPGLEAYLQAWWEDQEKLWQQGGGSEKNGGFPLDRHPVRTIFNILSSALGPLTRQDLINELTTEDDGINTLNLGRHLAPLERFVVGDGKTQGYVLAHPKLREFFYTSMRRAERAGWEHRFLDWGGRVLNSLESGRMLPSNVPGYIVQYYGVHLENGPGVGTCPPDHSTVLRRLVSDPWRKAWLAFEKTYTGFLSDVDRLAKSASTTAKNDAEKGVPTSGVADVFACALCHTSVRSLAVGIPPDLFAILVDTHQWTPEVAMAYVNHLPEEKFAAAVTRLAEYMPYPLLEGVLERTQNFRDITNVVVTFLAVAPRMPGSSRDEFAASVLAMLQSREDLENRAELLVELLPMLPEHRFHDVFADALTAARDVKPRLFSRIALLRLVPFAGHRRAEILAEAVEPWEEEGEIEPDNPMRNEHGIVRYFGLLGTNAQGDMQRDAVVGALSISDDVLFSGLGRARALIWMAPALKGVLQKTAVRSAIAAARRIPTHQFRAECLAELIPLVPPRARLVLTRHAIEAIRQVDSKIGREHNQTYAIRTLAPNLAPDCLEEVLSIVRGFREHRATNNQAEALCALAAHTLGPVRSSLSAESLRAAWRINDDWDRNQFLARACITLAEIGELEVAANYLGRLPTGAIKTAALVGMACCVSEPHQSAIFEQAIDMIEAAPEELFYQFENLTLLASRVPAGLKQRVVDVIVSAIKTYQNYTSTPQFVALTLEHIPDNHVVEQFVESLDDSTAEKPTLLAMLAARMPGSRGTSMLQTAEALALSSSDPKAVAGVIPFLPPESRRRALAAAMRPLRDSPDRDGSAFATLGPVLPRKLLSVALGWACSMEGWYARISAIAGLAPYLREERCMAYAFRCAQEAPPRWRNPALAALLPYAPETLRTQAIREELLAARETEEVADRFWIQKFADSLPGIHKWAGISAAVILRLSRWSFSYAFDRDKSLDRLVKALTPANGRQLSSFVCELLLAFNAQPRPEFIQDARSLLPLIGMSGGRPAVERCITSLQDTAEWWP